MNPRLVRRTLAALGVGAIGMLPAACGDSTPDASYFAIRPVTRQLAPPCAAPALGETRNGAVVACYEVGSTAVDAGDVSSATVVTSSVTNTSQVEFELTAQGIERFNALARTVGLGGQAAMVVDGNVVSAPTLQTLDFPGTGAVSGLDAAAADQLAKRLNAN